MIGLLLVATIGISYTSILVEGSDGSGCGCEAIRSYLVLASMVAAMIEILVLSLLLRVIGTLQLFGVLSIDSSSPFCASKPSSFDSEMVGKINSIFSMDSRTSNSCILSGAEG